MNVTHNCQLTQNFHVINIRPLGSMKMSLFQMYMYVTYNCQFTQNFMLQPFDHLAE